MKSQEGIKVKVLIVSAEVWRNDKNGGNVLSNIFQDTGFDFAQIYCNPGTPSNKFCRRYFQITDKMIINSILTREAAGEILEVRDYSGDRTDIKSENNAEQENKKFYNFFRKYRCETFVVAKEIIWKIGLWKSDKLKSFIKTFSPDIIFAPCYGSHAMLRIDRYLKQLCPDIPMVSYISDDFYTNQKWRLSPVFWLNHFRLRHSVRKTIRDYDLIYTMTEEQKKQCEKDFNANMKILRKSANFSNIEIKTHTSTPIRMIYAGGIYLNRWKTLSKLAEAIKRANKKEQLFQLDIYSNTPLKTKERDTLCCTKEIQLHKAVPFDELIKIYKKSDIALHVEGFDLKNKLMVRMSFSTKIVDCLMSGCATMAICDKKQAGYNYLKENNIAICIDDTTKLVDILQKIAHNPERICEYQRRAVQFGRRNHQSEKNTIELIGDFEKLTIRNDNI